MFNLVFTSDFFIETDLLTFTYKVLSMDICLTTWGTPSPLSRSLSSISVPGLGIFCLLGNFSKRLALNFYPIEINSSILKYLRQITSIFDLSKENSLKLDIKLRMFHSDNKSERFRHPFEIKKLY